MADINAIMGIINAGQMDQEQMLETLRGMSYEERGLLSSQLAPEHLDLLPQVETSVMHEGSGIEVSISPIDGTISIYAYGNPSQGDPLTQGSIDFSPEEGKVRHYSRLEITADGGVDTNEVNAVYDVNMQEGGQNPDLTESTVDVPNIGSSNDEVGISTTYSENGLLEVTVYDRGRISQGAVDVQYTDPETGMITKLSADENTVTVSTMDANGQVLSSGPIEMDQSFSENDFRYQPAPSMGPGLGN